MKFNLVSITLLAGLISQQAFANIGEHQPLNIKVLETKESLRKNTEEAMQRYMDQRKKLQVESKIKIVESKLAAREHNMLASRNPF